MNASYMTTLAVTSTTSLLCHVSTCFRIGSKFRCIRSTPIARESTSENDFECFASTGVKSPANAMFEHTNTRYPQVDFGILKWSTSAVCFGPPWAQQTSTLDLSVSLDLEAGVGLESQGGAIRADSCLLYTSPSPRD